MYTSLAILKNVSACQNGFTTQLEFWGLGKEVKDQRIPLHAIALIGGGSDCTWALNNGVVINPSEYEAVYKRHALDVWRRLLNDNNVYANLHSMQLQMQKQKKNKPKVKVKATPARAFDEDEEEEDEVCETHAHKERLLAKYRNPGYAFYRRAVDCKTVHEVDTLIAELRYNTYSIPLWQVILHEAWKSPKHFLLILLEFVSDIDQENFLCYTDMGKSISIQLFDGLVNNKKLNGDSRVAVALKPEGTYDFLYELQIEGKRAGVKIERDVTDRSFTIYASDPETALMLVKYAVKRTGKTTQITEREILDETNSNWGVDQAIATSEANVYFTVPTTSITRLRTGRATRSVSTTTAPIIMNSVRVTLDGNDR